MKRFIPALKTDSATGREYAGMTQHDLGHYVTHDPKYEEADVKISALEARLADIKYVVGTVIALLYHDDTERAYDLLQAALEKLDE